MSSESVIKCDRNTHRSWCTEFFRWYNAEHHYDGIALFTPEQGKSTAGTVLRMVP
jgi:hypothetical protein